MISSLEMPFLQPDARVHAFNAVLHVEDQVSLRPSAIPTGAACRAGLIIGVLERPLPLSEEETARGQRLASPNWICPMSDTLLFVRITEEARSSHFPPRRWSSTDGQLKWIIENGIRFSGMPGWKGELEDNEMWSIVGFLRHLPEKGSQGIPGVYKEGEEEHHEMTQLPGNTVRRHQHPYQKPPPVYNWWILPTHSILSLDFCGEGEGPTKDYVACSEAQCPAGESWMASY